MVWKLNLCFGLNFLSSDAMTPSTWSQTILVWIYATPRMRWVQRITHCESNALLAMLVFWMWTFSGLGRRERLDGAPENVSTTSTDLWDCNLQPQHFMTLASLHVTRCIPCLGSFWTISLFDMQQSRKRIWGFANESAEVVLDVHPVSFHHWFLAFTLARMRCSLVLDLERIIQLGTHCNHSVRYAAPVGATVRLCPFWHGHGSAAAHRATGMLTAFLCWSGISWYHIALHPTPSQLACTYAVSEGSMFHSHLPPIVDSPIHSHKAFVSTVFLFTI